MANERALFVTRLGGILAAVGSAVGLGNIWRFPYETGQNGGAAFLIVYIVCVLLIGTPLMLAELTLGRSTHRNPVGAMKALLPGTIGKAYSIWGYLGGLCQLLIIGFYSVVAGWTLHYMVTAIGGQTPDFPTYSADPVLPMIGMTVFFLLNGLVVLGGVQKGIERASNIMMPVLFILLVVLCVNSLTLNGAKEGLTYLFHPDFSKITPEVIVSAMGQSFFSISVGIGCLLTYGSYLGDGTAMGKTAVSITLLDTLIAILSGIVIFPACFSFNVMPDAGPGLAFITLPAVFAQMPGGYIWEVLFFVLLSLAALTSSISMLETPIAILQEEFGCTRRKAVIYATTFGYCLGLLCSLVPFCFDLFDGFTANYMMPLLGLLMSVFVGWIMPRKKLEDTLTNGGTGSGWYIPVFMFLVRYFAPLCILTIFINGLL